MEYRKRNPGKARIDQVSMRLDPKTSFLLELCARSQRRSRANYMEWLIVEAFKTTSIRDESRGQTYTVAQLEEKLWHPDEAERLNRMRSHFPNLLTFGEEQILSSLPEIPEN